MRYSPGRTYSLVLHSDAEADLDRIYEEDEDVGADIEVFLEEAKNNQETLDNLTRRKYVEYGEWPYNVDEWQETKSSKYNLWRVRLLWFVGSAAKYRGLSRFLCISILLGVGKAVFETNHHLTHGLFPVLYRHRPTMRDVA